MISTTGCTKFFSVESLEHRRMLAGTPLNVTVEGQQWGITTKFIGAVEGSARFNISDLTDMGVNTYRLYGGMSRWERTDDDGVYGSPSIAQIKADVNAVKWSAWDNVMTSPPGGSDYSWTSAGAPVNARTIFSQLKAAGIRPVVTLRNRDNVNKPTWIPSIISTEAAKNEWWEHVFATVYWMNVRNDYRVDDWELGNEPNNKDQGFTGTQAQYFEFAKLTSDAIKYVYSKYLPGRTPHIHAPKTTGGSSWPDAALKQMPDAFDTMNVHNYSGDITTYTRQVHGYMNAAGKSDMELWIGEWGTYSNNYASVQFDTTLIQNLIRGSRPGDDYVTGNHIFSMYDWGKGKGAFKGLVASNGNRTPAYYAMRMATRALQGGRATFRAAEDATDVIALGTKDAAGNVYLLVSNRGATPFEVNADLSAHLLSGTGTMWQFSAGKNDVVVGSPTLVNGHTNFTMLGNSAFLLKFPPGASVTSAPLSVQPVSVAPTQSTFVMPVQQHAIALVEPDTDLVIGSRDM